MGTVALIPDARPAQFSFDKADGQIGCAGDWAGAAAGNMLATSTSEPLLDLPVGVATAVLAPAVAVNGALSARKHLSPDKLSECEANLLKAMREMAVQQHFHDCLLKAADEQCRGRLIPLDQAQAADPDAAGSDSTLEARIEELRLERSGSSDTSYRLRIKARMRLVRAADGVVLYDQPAEYLSGTCLFSDWTLRDSVQKVANTGYRQLAEQCVSRLLATADKPTLLGAGYRTAPAPDRNPAVRLAANLATPNRSGKYLVSYAMTDTGTLGIYSTGTVTHVVLQEPLTRDQAGVEAREDVDVMFDGLNAHPNMLVALPACAVAVPISLWKQGVAVVRGLSAGELQEAEAKLTEAANQTTPHQELAVQVAQQLAPQTSEPVMLVRRPPLPGLEDDPALMHCVSRGTLASLTGDQTAGSYLLSQGADAALEIHVESARLSGKEGINPKLALCVEARATLLRSRDGQQLYSCPVQYRSQGRKFTEWAAHDARLFREELQKCYHDLSAAIVDQLVARGAVPPASRPHPAFASK